MSQKVKLEAEKPTVKLEPGPSTKLESNPSLKTETDEPAVKMEPGPSDILKPEPKTETEEREDEDEMETSAYEDSEDSEEDSDNPDNYHPMIYCDPYDHGDPYREATDVGHLVVDLGTGKEMNFENDANGDYKCPEMSCKYTTKKKDLMGRHYKVHGEKQYECKVCAKKFGQRVTCMNHIRTHDDRWKFRCDVCRKRFSVYRQLKTHCLAKHGLEVESRRGRYIVPAGYEIPMVPLPRINRRGKLW